MSTDHVPEEFGNGDDSGAVESDSSAEYYADEFPSAAEFADTMRRIAEERERRRREEACRPSLEPFAVSWDSITFEQVALFERRLETATKEQEMQDFFEEYPTLLIQPLSGGHGRWVIPHKRLGAEHVPDFMIAECSSIGFEWTAVELESPTARMFTKRGEVSSTTDHAIRQIEDWRVWLGRNRDYAARPRDESGLGLVDIDANVSAWVILGRRATLPADTRERRRERSQRMNIKLHSYEWLLERALSRAEHATRSRPPR